MPSANSKARQKAEDAGRKVLAKFKPGLGKLGGLGKALARFGRGLGEIRSLDEVLAILRREIWATCPSSQYGAPICS